MNVRKIIAERKYGKIHLPPPFNAFFQFKYILIKDGAIVEKEEVRDRWPAWMACNIGGPILLIVFDGNALYLERGNKFSRVVGPGEIAPFLEWFETIKYVVDLRPKVKVGSFDVWTKDGIKIGLTVRVESRIGDPAKRDPEGKLVYPYDPVAVKKAVERIALRWPDPTQEPSEFTWVDAVWGQVTGILPSYIGSRYLDDLLLAERQSGQILSADAMKAISDDLNKATQVFGVFVTDLQIVKVEIPEEIRKLQEEYWKAERESIITLTEGQAKAFEIRAQEKARAEAQRDLLLTIANGLEKTRSNQFTRPLLLTLSSILDQSLSDPSLKTYLAKETLEILEKLQKILDRPAI
ncbi:MAG: SPFH domain-containing protein [Anaerolineales bacterium]